MDATRKATSTKTEMTLFFPLPSKLHPPLTPRPSEDILPSESPISTGTNAEAFQYSLVAPPSDRVHMDIERMGYLSLSTSSIIVRVILMAVPEITMPRMVAGIMSWARFLIGSSEKGV